MEKAFKEVEKWGRGHVEDEEDEKVDKTTKLDRIIYKI